MTWQHTDAEQGKRWFNMFRCHFEDARSRFKVRFLPGSIRSPSPRASYHLAWLVADLPEVARSSSAWQAVASSRARNLTFFRDLKEVTPKLEMLMLQLGLKEQIQGVAAQAAWAPQLLSLCQGLQDLLSELRTFLEQSHSFKFKIIPFPWCTWKKSKLGPARWESNSAQHWVPEPTCPSGDSWKESTPPQDIVANTIQWRNTLGNHTCCKATLARHQFHLGEWWMFLSNHRPGTKKIITWIWSEDSSTTQYNPQNLTTFPGPRSSWDCLFKQLLPGCPHGAITELHGCTHNEVTPFKRRQNVWSKHFSQHAILVQLKYKFHAHCNNYIRTYRIDINVMCQKLDLCGVWGWSSFTATFLQFPESPGKKMIPCVL